MKHWNEENIRKLETFINDCRLNRGYCPTILEMAAATGIPKTTVSRYLSLMKERGIIVNPCSRHMETRTSAKAAGTVSVPLLGRVSCGPLKDAVEDIEEYVRIPRSWCGPGEYFALRANGSSMINVGIDDGDMMKKGITQEKLAELMGLSRRTVQRILSASSPTLERVVAICIVLSIPYSLSLRIVQLSGNAFIFSKQHDMYQSFLMRPGEISLQRCNDILAAANLPPLMRNSGSEEEMQS